MYTKVNWIRCRSVFAIFCRFRTRRLYLLVIDTLTNNRFNVVVVNGHDDNEMWTIGPANYPYSYDARDTAIGLELEEAFTLNVGRKGRDVEFNSSY